VNKTKKRKCELALEARQQKAPRLLDIDGRNKKYLSTAYYFGTGD